MDYNTARLDSWPSRLVLRVSAKLRSNKGFTNEAIAKKEAKDAAKRRAMSAPQIGRKSTSSRQDDVNELGERQYSIFSETSTLVDGHRHKPDNTDMMHRLAHYDSFDSLVDQTYIERKHRHDDGLVVKELRLEQVDPYVEAKERMVASLPADVWCLISSFLCPADAAHLTIASKTLHEKLGKAPFHALELDAHRHEKVAFLNHMDRHLPGHLFCFPCGTYHKRTRRGSEKLLADYVNNPLFECPQVRASVLPRMRLTFDRVLPYAFVQLATRAARHSDHHGIKAEGLDRKWKDKSSGWSHHTRYMIHDGRLLMRVRSQAFAAPKLTETGLRHLLYDREEYLPYFSVCAHWRDGELMKTCKCALSHIPEPPRSLVAQLKTAPRINFAAVTPCYIVRGCDDCAPARRCPECPTEYLIEINMAEDKNDPVNRFKHVLVVTRWSDLGDGSSPTASPEWAAINGKRADYQSFSHVGRRAVGGIFESKMSGSIPGQRLVSLNPKNEKLGEEGHGWY